MENLTYKISVYCKNCDFKGEIEILKGATAEDTICSVCGNKKLEKDQPVVISSYYNFN